VQKKCKRYAISLWVVYLFSEWYICEMITGNVLIGAVKTNRESDINFRTGSVVYSKKTDQNGIVVTKDQYGRNKMINNAQTPVYFPKTKKIVAVYNRYLVSLDDK
jgi:hypothetical protein